MQPNGGRLSQAASQASLFFEQVARERRAFTFVSDGEPIVLPLREGELCPFWSSRTRLERVQTAHARYRALQIQEVSLDRFLSELLPRLESEQIRVGANWSGARLSGYDYTVADIRKNLDHWCRKFQKA